MKIHRSLAVLSLLVLILYTTLGAAVAQQEDIVAPPQPAPVHGPSPEIASYQNIEQHEIYRLRLVNDENGAITGSRDQGINWQQLGKVLGYTEQVTTQGYTASKWAPIGAVAATAVNAIHIRTGYNATDDKGVVFSILPRELLTDAGKKLQSFYSADSSIYTDIAGGTGIFGGHWSPILGNTVYLENAGNLTPMPENYIPHKGDVFVIIVLRPINSPKSIIFENRFGGFISIIGWDESVTVVGQVLRPVAGVGRFLGTQYADIGRLRANHNGVIDVSVSPFGTVGGFQILPREHAMSPEMVRARTMTQWMVIGPLDARDPSWEGVAPLFLNYLCPSWEKDDWDAPNWRERVAARTLVDVRIQNGPWRPMPHFSLDPDLSKPFPEWANYALQDITHIRILFPSIEDVKDMTPLPIKAEQPDQPISEDNAEIPTATK